MTDSRIGQRIQMHPARSEWMQGDRYGEARQYVNTFTREIELERPLRIRLDKSGRIVRAHPDEVTYD